MAPLLSVHATAKTLLRGEIEGWWTAANGLAVNGLDVNGLAVNEASPQAGAVSPIHSPTLVSEEAALSEDTCQQRCAT